MDPGPSLRSAGMTSEDSCCARLPLAHAVAQQPRLRIDLVNLDGERQRARLEHRIERFVRLIVDRLHGVLLLL